MASTNLAQFNAELDRVSKKMLDEDVVRFIQSVCFEAFRRIVLRTPIDTGRARGNWQIEINRPAEGIVDMELWSSVLERAATKLARIPPFSVVHITNNVEYVYYLEYVRRSKQHPEGMVEITLQELTVWLKSA